MSSLLKEPITSKQARQPTIVYSKKYRNPQWQPIPIASKMGEVTVPKVWISEFVNGNKFRDWNKKSKWYKLLFKTTIGDDISKKAQM
jgi:hypothetical protein